LSGESICVGMIVLFLMEIKREERPKRPVNRGKRGCFIGRFRVAKPKKPARVKTVNAIKGSFSLRIR